jgi:exonuclease SbcD
MAETLTFIHAADLHLGAPFRGLRHSSEVWADRMAQALVMAYRRLIDYALDRQVDFVILAGDTFDSAHPSYAECLRFVEGLRRLDAVGIPVYVCTGNHDPYVSWQNDYLSLPANTHLFSATGPGYFCYERAGKAIALLAGRGFYRSHWRVGEDPVAGLTRAAVEAARGCTAPFAIGVLHTGLDRDRDKAPVSPASLSRTGMDYWALGHFHKPEVVDDAANPHVVYSGNIQGCAMDEPGLRGVSLVTLQKGRPNNREFLPTSSIVWETVAVDVADCATVEDVADSIRRGVDSLRHVDGGCPLITRVTLRGKTNLHDALRDAHTTETLRQQMNSYDDQVYCDAVIDETRAPIDKARLRASATFAGEFLRVVERNAQDHNAACAYLQQAFADEGLSLPPTIAEQVGSIAHQAEDAVLERLGADCYGK